MNLSIVAAHYLVKCKIISLIIMYMLVACIIAIYTFSGGHIRWSA